MLGELVNVVARHMREQAGDYVRDIKAPALKLLGLYGLQVRYVTQSSSVSNIWND